MDFTNEFGELWDEDFENKHNMSHWDSKPLEVFLVPHSHQDPGKHRFWSCHFFISWFFASTMRDYVFLLLLFISITTRNSKLGIFRRT